MTSGVVLLTCSMARDLEIFSVLATSVDRCAGPDVPHVVIVPRADLAAFRRHATPAREIVAQEDILPMWLFKLPSALRHLAFLTEALRRPIYVSAKGQVTRGWMIQQILKIEYTRRAPSEAVVHVDSDVFFVRPFAAADARRDGKIMFFRVDQAQSEPGHRRWGEVAASCLGTALPEGWSSHYVENCVPWSREVAQAMVQRIEAVHGRPYHEVLLGFPTISEYFIYGLFADLIGADPSGQAPGLAPGDMSLCNSFWPASPDQPFDLVRQMERMLPWHRALAIQSTHAFPVAERARVFETALAAR